MGLVLLSLGVFLFLVSSLNATKTDTVIDISFVLEPNGKYGPYEKGTYHHTRVISKSTLIGEVEIKGGGIYFTANGYDTQHLKTVFINQNYSFVIDPADDIYTFTFENIDSNIQSSVKFTLKEKWIKILLLIPGFIGLLILTPMGLFLSIMNLRKKLTQAHPRILNRTVSMNHHIRKWHRPYDLGASLRVGCGLLSAFRVC